MTLGLAARITLVVVAILGAGVAMTAVLSAHKFERTLADFLTSRFEFKVNDIRRRIETQLDLGLTLSDLQDSPEILEEYLQNDEQILSIEVFDETGAVLFSTDPSFVGDLVVEEWLVAWRASRGRETWSAEERAAHVIGAPLKNNLDRDVGSLALRYSREVFDGSVAAQTSRLWIIGAFVVLGMALFGVVGAMLLLRRVHDDLVGLREAMDDVAAWRRDGGALERARARYPAFAAFAATVLSARDEIDEAIVEIRRLDEEQGI